MKAQDSSKLIAIVEDDPDVARIIEQVLSDFGFATLWCRSGGDLLRRLRTLSPDLCIIDLGLPDIFSFRGNGWMHELFTASGANTGVAVRIFNGSCRQPGRCALSASMHLAAGNWVCCSVDRDQNRCVQQSRFPPCAG